MKLKKIACFLLVLVVLFSFSTFTVNPSAEVGQTTSAAFPSPNADRVLAARFLNMLNHNYVYDTGFDTSEELVNGAVIALLSYEEDSFIPAAYVQDYIFNMYGVELADFSQIHAQYPVKEGYVYVIPCGYSVYSHSMESLSENEDGTYTVVTAVTITTHEGETVNAHARSLFVRNDRSAFGFHLLSSDILTDLSAM